MAHPYHHAESTARKWGGVPADYEALHAWFDQTKEHYADFRHRCLRHHAEGIFELERVFGTTVVNSEGKHVPVRIIGEQHVKEDCGWIPTIKDWLENLTAQPWMHRPEKLNRQSALTTEPCPK